MTSSFQFLFCYQFASLLLVILNSSDLTSINSPTSILSQTKLVTQANNNAIFLTQRQICQAFAFTTAKCTVNNSLHFIFKIYKQRPSFRQKYRNNHLHLARKYARIFVRGHCLFPLPKSFPKAQLEENCELRGTANVQGQISEHIFALNGDYSVYYPSNLLRNARSFENWGIFINYYSFKIFPRF